MKPARTRLLFRHMLPACALVVVVATAAGCSSSGNKADKGPTTTPVSISATPSPDPTAQAKAAVITAYKGMWAAAVKMYQVGSVVSPDLQTYAIDKALSNVKVTALYYQDHGLVMRGQPILNPQVTAISFASQPHTATITDCIDSGRFTAVYKATGKPAPATSNHHHIQTSTARYNGHAWVISDFTIERDRTC